MKKLLSLLALLTLLSCSNDKVVVNSAELPEWFVNPSYDGKLAGVGIAGKSKGGIAVQRPIAITLAKGDLAERIKSNISRISKVALQQAKSNNLDDDFTSNFEQATTVLVKNLPLSGVTPVNIKQINGELYVRVALDGKDYSKYINDMQKNLEKKISESRQTSEAIKKSLDATKELFNELKK